MAYQTEKRKINFDALIPEVRVAAVCIGLDHKQPYVRFGKRLYRAYRNYYDCLRSNLAHDVWMVLVGKGYARKIYEEGAICRFALTRKGMDWLGQWLGITITHGNGRYPE